MLVPMIRVLQRHIRSLMVVGCGLVVGCLVGVYDRVGATVVTRYGLQGAAITYALLLVWRFLLVMVSLDPDKPRAARRRNAPLQD